MQWNTTQFQKGRKPTDTRKVNLKKMLVKEGIYRREGMIPLTWNSGKDKSNVTESGSMVVWVQDWEGQGLPEEGLERTFWGDDGMSS